MSNIKNILKKKLATIPKDWGVAELGKIGQSIIGLTYSPNDIVDHSGTLVLRSSNIVGNHIDYSDGVYVNKAIPEKLIVKEGDILVCARNGSRGLIGKNAYIDKISAGNSFGAFMSVYRTSSSPFVFQFFQSEPFRKQIYRNLGATINQITTKNLNEFIIPFPPLPEQKKIAEILGKWDDGIETVEKLIAAKKKLKKALMQQLLTGKKRFKEFEGQEWEEYPIGNLLKEIKRPVEFNDNELYELISIRRRSGGLFLRERLYGHQIKVKDLRDAHKGDFLISKMQVVRGALGLTTAEFNGMKISGSYIALIPRNPEKLDIEFYSFRTHLPDMYHKIYRSCYGVHIEKMTFNMKLYFQEKLLIPPSVKEQQKIALVLNAADKEIELLNNKLEALKNQKKGLMQKLLTGKTRVNV